MSLLSLWSVLRGAEPRRSRSARRRLSTRPAVEILEDRTVPSKIGVNILPAGDAIAALGISAPANPALPIAGNGAGSFTDAAGGFSATGTARFLGAFTHYGTLVLTPTDDPTIVSVSGDTTYEAANGDKIYVSLSGPMPYGILYIA